jgi:ketosteroid isomerase-like protein
LVRQCHARTGAPKAHCELRNGRVYNQQRHIQMTVLDGKISSVREYLDTQHVFAIWFQR